MSISAHTSRRLGTSIACAVAAALIAVPLASASGSQGTITENSATQNRVGLQNSYNQLDPWLYRLLHGNSAGQNRLDQQGTYGQLNPWLHHMLHETNAYSASSGPVESRVATSDTRASGGVVPSSSRFPWRDIAIGAAGTLAVALLAAGALFAVRRTRGRFAPVS